MGMDGAIDIPVEVFGSYDTERTPETQPIGVSPFNQDCQYIPGGVKTRPGISQAVPNATPLTYIKTFVDQTGANHTLYLDNDGTLWQEYPQGTYTEISSGITARSLCQSVSAFGREFLAFSDGKFGTDIPRWFDGTYFDRVSQVGPGAPPSVVDYLPPPTTIASAGGGTSATIAASPTGAVTTDPYTIRIPPYPPYYPGGTYTIYQTATFTTTTAHGFSAGDPVNISGVTDTIFNSIMGVPILSVPSPTTFKVSFTSGIYAASGSGTATVPQPSALRTGNVVTIYTSAAHGFSPGWDVNVTGIPVIAIGGGIASVTQQGGVVTITTNTPHGLVVDSESIVAGVSDATYDGTWPVSDVPSPTSFQYLQTTSTASSSGGTVSTTFDGIFLIQSTPTPESFTYSQLGPDVQSSSGGTATIIGNVAPGIHQVALMFVTRGGYITKPSPWATFNAAGGKLLSLSNVATGPPNIVARILIFTATIAASQEGQTSGTFYAILPNMQIADNTTTQVVIDFSDAALIAGVDYTEQFNLLELGECAGVTSYVNRLFWWGERAKLNNLVNLTFDGGWQAGDSQTEPAGIGQDAGGGHPWTTPNNLPTTGSSYATITGIGVMDTSNPLQAEQFGFSVANDPAGIIFSLNIQGSIGSTGPSTMNVQLLKGGVPVGTPKSLLLNGSPPGIVTFGASSDLWGAALDAADVNSSTFGVQITVYLGTGGSGTLELNSASLTVYELPQAPLGWTQVAAGSQQESNTVVFGNALRITGDGSTAYRGILTQNATADYLGQPIIQINTGYSARVRVLASGLTQGILDIDLYSPTYGNLGPTLQVPYNLCSATDFIEFIGPIWDSSGSVPNDLVLRVYGAGTMTLDGYFIVDDIEIFPTNQPYNDSAVRASYAFLPEAYDSITGQIQVSPTDGQSVRCCSKIRSTLYISKQFSDWSAATDNTNEPSLWPVQPVSTSVGCLSVHSAGVFEGETGEDWMLLIGREGLFIFDSGSPVKITQEIETDSSNTAYRPRWDQINWNYAHTSWLTIDVQTRRLFVGVPMFGATSPNIILHMDFKPLGSSATIAAGAPVHVSEYTGRILSKETQRKWSPWSIAANCGALVERSDGTAHVMFGVTQAENYPYGSFPIPSTWSLAATVDGGAYELLDTNVYDALVIGGVAKNYPIYSYYMTAYLPDAQQRLNLVQILNTPRILMNYMTLFSEGSGDLRIFTILPGNTLGEALPRSTAPPFTLSNPATRDIEVYVNTSGYRVAILFTATFPPLDGGGNPQNVGNWFELRKLSPMVKNDPATPYRGIN
jgi:hypothetical protein